MPFTKGKFYTGLIAQFGFGVLMSLQVRMRTFIAIDIDERIRRQLAAVQDALRPKAGRMKWVDPDSMHLTLKFLGDTTPAQAEAVSAELAEISAATAPFDIRVEGLGVFGPRGPVRVIWTGVADPHGRLVALRDAVEARVAPLGFPTEARPFSPHLTLARSGREPPNPHLREIVARLPAFCAGEQLVTELVLYESMLTRARAIYEPVSHHCLSTRTA